MALVNRLAGIPGWDEKLPVHQFYASLFELARGELTKAQVVAFWSLDAGEESELDWIISQYQAAADKPAYLERVHCVLLLAEIGAPGYDTNAGLQAKLTA